MWGAYKFRFIIVLVCAAQHGGKPLRIIYACTHNQPIDPFRHRKAGQYELDGSFADSIIEKICGLPVISKQWHQRQARLRYMSHQHLHFSGAVYVISILCTYLQARAYAFHKSELGGTHKKRPVHQDTVAAGKIF